MLNAEAFWKKVNKNGAIPSHNPQLGACWEWLGAKSKSGYGSFQAEINGRKITARAHRLAWLECAQIPKEMELDHLCRNRACVKPQHLEVVTHLENVRRGKIAQKTHCIRGHLLSGSNLRRDQRGHRVCNQCRLLHIRESRKHLPRRNKLSIEQVKEIRQLTKGILFHSGMRGVNTISAIAKRYGVSRCPIQRIANGTGWQTV